MTTTLGQHKHPMCAALAIIQCKCGGKCRETDNLFDRNPERQSRLLSAFAAAPALASPSLSCDFCAPRASLHDPELFPGDLLCGECLRGTTIYGAIELHLSEFGDGEVVQRQSSPTNQELILRSVSPS